jgi:hypothetical protein
MRRNREGEAWGRINGRRGGVRDGAACSTRTGHRGRRRGQTRETREGHGLRQEGKGSRRVPEERGQVV